MFVFLQTQSLCLRCMISPQTLGACGGASEVDEQKAIAENGLNTALEGAGDKEDVKGAMQVDEGGAQPRERRGAATSPRTLRSWRSPLQSNGANAPHKATKAESATRNAARRHNWTANFAMLAKSNAEQQHKDVTRGDEGGGRHQSGGEEQQLHHDIHGVRGLVAILLYKA